MAVERIHLTSTLRVTDMEDQTINSYRQIAPNITQARANAFLEGMAAIRGGNIGNGFITVTTELAETAQP